MDEAQFPEAQESQTRSPRRAFVTQVSAVVLGGLAMTAPVAAGFMVLLDPLRRRSSDQGLVRVTSMQALPEDGSPRKFAVIATHTDAWNSNPAVPVGAVYIRRTGPSTAQAFNVVCPHAGCFVNYQPGRQSYLCPCHNSAFGLDGRISNPRSPSPRGLDELQVEIRNEGEVWVRFQNFRAGTERKIAVA